MDEPPFSLAFIMVKESFAGPAILIYLASDANKNKRQDHLNLEEPIRLLGATNARRAGREQRGNLRGGCVSKLCVD
jgi:hypothetical protein